MAIGSQNAFVLKQGLKRQHVLLVCLLCSVSDAVLIALGVAGFGVIVQQFPVVESVARYAGAAFLGVYGLLSFKSAFSQTHALQAAAQVQDSALKITLMCLAFTWLNPHVYLDTVVLLGSLSTQYAGSGLAFALGAMAASVLFFFSLGYGAGILAPVFQRPAAWKVLEFLVGVIMWSIAASLLLG
ncbi:MAG: LysE/ArgO family amino acid transporter [Thiolinea sp.]